MLQIFCRWIVRTFFREIAIDGLEDLPNIGPVIFTPNHPNALLDPLLLFLLPKSFRIRFVAKSTLFTIPVFGSLLRKMGSIPVARRLDTQGEVDYTVFFASCVTALEKGDSIVIFPEGRSLPQPYLAPMKTGPARLYFMALDRGIKVNIVPIGLNYERGAIFRTSVLMSIAPPVDTSASEAEARVDPRAAVHHLTDLIGQTLERHVFQAETFRDRELILLLERLYSEKSEGTESWPDRLTRLKQFEDGFQQLRSSHEIEINSLRHLLTRYERLSSLSGIDVAAQRKHPTRPFFSVLAGIVGMIFAGIGVVLNWVPYHIVDFLVKLGHKDESDAATYKVVYSIFAFPTVYLLEGWFLKHYLGWIPAILFAIFILPLSYFTLLFFEWHGETGGRSPASSFWLGGTARRVTSQLDRLRDKIVEQVNELASLRTTSR